MEAMKGRELPRTVGLREFHLGAAQDATRQLPSDYPLLDALVVASNLMAIGALRALGGAGKRIPDDVAFVGIEDPPGADLVGPAMITHAQPTHQMVQSAVELLVDRITKRRSQSCFVIFHFRFSVRKCCGPAMEVGLATDNSVGPAGVLELYRA